MCVCGGGGGHIPQQRGESGKDEWINKCFMHDGAHGQGWGATCCPAMMQSDKRINQHTIRARDFIYGTDERSSGRIWQMSFLAN